MADDVTQLVKLEVVGHEAMNKLNASLNQHNVAIDKVTSSQQTLNAEGKAVAITLRGINDVNEKVTISLRRVADGWADVTAKVIKAEAAIKKMQKLSIDQIGRDKFGNNKASNSLISGLTQFTQAEATKAANDAKLKLERAFASLSAVGSAKNGQRDFISKLSGFSQSFTQAEADRVARDAKTKMDNAQAKLNEAGREGSTSRDAIGRLSAFSREQQAEQQLAASRRRFQQIATSERLAAYTRMQTAEQQLYEAQRRAQGIAISERLAQYNRLRAEEARLAAQQQQFNRIRTSERLAQFNRERDAELRQEAARRTFLAIRNRERQAVNNRAFEAGITEQELTRLQQRFGEVGAAGQRAGQGILLSWQSVVRLFTVQVIHQAIARLTTEFIEATSRAAEYRVKIAEIQTLTQSAGQTSGQWASSINALSREFGSPQIETARGLYEAISNQIVKTADDTRFMTDALKLATITTASAADGVDAISSVLNSFNKDVSESSRVAAVLFKTVDLGRVRLDEMANAMGRTNALSQSLGISFEEQSAALVILTNQGIKADVAFTLLNNIYNQLIKPSKEMTNVLAELGVSSGKAAVQTFGLQGVLQLLTEQAKKGGDATTELGKIFEDIRGLTGFEVLSQNLEKFPKTMEEFTKSVEEAGKAVEIVLADPGKRLQVEFNKVEILMTEFGNKFGDKILSIADTFGGLDVGVSRLIDGLGLLITAYGTYQVVAGAAAARTALLAYQTDLLALANLQAAGNVQALEVAQARIARIHQAFATFLATGAITALVVYYQYMQNYQARIDEAIRGAEAKARTEFEKTNAVVQAKADQRNIILDQYYRKQFQIFFEYAAEVQKGTAALVVNLEKDFKDLGNVVQGNLNQALDGVQARLKKIVNEADNLRQSAEKIRADIVKQQGEAADRQFDQQLIGKSPEQQLKLMLARLRTVRQEALDFIGKDEIKAAQQRFEEEEKLQRQIVEKLGAFRNKNNVAANNPKVDELERRRDELIAQAQFANKPKQALGFLKQANDVDRKLQAEQAKEAAAKGNVNVAAGLQLKIEKEINVAIAERIKFQEDFAAKQEALAGKKEAEAKAMEGEIKNFQNLLSELDAFDPKQEGAADKFKAKLAAVEAALGKLGIDPAKQIEILRAAKSQQLLLERAYLQQVQQEGIESYRKTVEAQEKILKESRDKQNATDAAARQTKGAAQIAAAREIAGIQALVDEIGIGGGPNGAVDENGNRRGKQQLLGDKKAEIQDTLDKLKAVNQLTKVDPNDADAFNRRIELFKQLREQLEALEALNKRNGGKLLGKGAFGLTNPVNEDGKLIVKPDGVGQKEEDTKAVFDNLTKVQDAAVKAQKEALAANTALGNQLKFQKELAITLGKVPQHIRDAAKAREEATPPELNSLDQVNERLRIEIERLERIEELVNRLKNDPNFQNGRPVEGGGFGPRAYRAAGGPARGTDTIPAMLSAGEYVWDSKTTRQFYPLISALHQQGRGTGYYAGGGNVTTNVGDINVNVTGGSNTPQTIKQIMQGMRREIRRGALTR